MRIESVLETNKSLSKNCKLNTEEGRQMASLAVLTDISETLALLVDVYASVHGREIKTKNGEEQKQ